MGRKEYDFVLFDSPPLLIVSDAGILAPRMDGVILVISSGRTTRRASIQAKIQLERLKANLVGVILNQVERGESGYYPYKYYPYYSPKSSEERKTE